MKNTFFAKSITILLILMLFVGCNNIIPSSPVDYGTSSANYGMLSEDFIYKMDNNFVEIISYENKNAENVMVPESIDGCLVTTIGADAFYQCKYVKSITLPKHTTTIVGSPFYRCYSLEKIYIPQNVENIDANPFFRCESLIKITVDSENDKFIDEDGILFDKEKTVLISYPEGKDIKEYIIPSSVTKLNIDSFGYKTKLREIVILSNVTDFPEGNMFVYPEELSLIVERGSEAEKYAKKHNINFRYYE